MTTTRYRWIAALLLCGVLGVPAMAAEKDATKATDSEARMKKDLAFLASNECEGRGPLTKGIDRAADHIAAEFKKIGLKPAGKNDDYFQPFTFKGNRLVKEPTLVFKGPRGEELNLKLGTDYQPFGMSYSGAIKDVPVVFAGYGVTAPTRFEYENSFAGFGLMARSKTDYDDYKDVQASGAVVIVLRDVPRASERRVGIEPQKRRDHASFTIKMTNAESHGALGILYVNDRDTAKDGDELLDFTYTATARLPEKKLPAMMIKRAILETMLKGTGKGLSDREDKMEATLKPASVELKGWTVSLEIKTNADSYPAKNVIGVLEGAGPLAEETVVVGAHYDHLGYGGASSLSGLKKMSMHFGADDNGSGTTSMLELARRFAAMKDRKGRRIVFIAFSCEEMGLNGSVHYCKNPLIPLEKTVAMVNLDMVGRLDVNNKKNHLQLHGTGTAKGFNELIDILNKVHNLPIIKKAGGTGPSDHDSFYRQKIPVIFFFTGDHNDYHRPSDTADKINYEGMRRIVDFAEGLTQHLTTVAQRPEYVKVADAGPGPGSGGGPRLGIKPGYNEDTPGLLVEGVTDGFPAQKGGIKAGDNIIVIDGVDIKNIEGYMQQMAKKKPGDTIEVTVEREKKKMMLKVKLE